MQYISTVGFPIVACGAMGWYITQQNKNHKEEVDHMVKAIENNTIALTKLLERMDNDND